MARKTNRIGASVWAWAVVGAAGLSASLSGVVSAQVSSTTTTTTTTTVTQPPPGPIVIVPPVPPRRRPQAPVPVELTAVAANARIEEQVATTEMEFTLHNGSSTPQEAQLMIPVPEGVSVRSFQYDGTGPEPTAKIMPKDEARRIYDSIVNAQKDPGLLEFVGYSMIRSSVFPVPAGATQKVRVVYEQLLPADGERVDYVLPRSEGLDSLRHAGGQGVPWNMTVSIKSKRPISTVYSPSHDIVTQRVSANEVKVNLPANAATAPGALRLAYLLEKQAGTAGNGLTTTVLAYPDPDVGGGKGGYFLLLAGLPSERPDRTPVKREVVMVLDRSGSMRGEKIEQARAAALQVLNGLEAGEAFNIVDYSDSIRSFSPVPVVKDNKTAEEARNYLRSIQAEGGTNLHDAILEAIRPAPTQGMLPMVLFMTDGLPTVGEKSELKIREDVKTANTQSRRIFSFGVGYDVNAPLLTGIATGSRGASTFVLPQEDVEVKVSQVFRRLSGPALASPTLAGGTGASGVREIQGGIAGATLPDLFEGDQLVVLGQYTGDEQVTMRLSGSFFGKERTFEVALDPKHASNQNSYVPRLWAGRKIASMLDEIRQSGANGNAATDPRTKELVDEIVRLSTRFGILTEYTAFLATDPVVAMRARVLGEAAPAAVPMSAAPGRAADESVKLVTDRAGRSSVAQERNRNQQVEMKSAQTMNCYYDADMNEVRIAGVQQVRDVACINRSGRWVDTRLLAKESETPDKTVEFGTPEYRTCLDQLVKEGRQGLLAFDGDVLVEVAGQRVLFKNPS